MAPAGRQMGSHHGLRPSVRPDLRLEVVGTQRESGW